MLPARVDVATARNPFEGVRQNGYANEGQTIREMIAAQGLRDDGSYGVVCTLNGELVPERMLERVRPKAGAQVVLRVVPRGGDTGKAILSIVLSVVMIAAAVFMPAGLAAAGMFGGAGITAAEGALAASMLIGGISGVATGIQSLVAPPPQVPFGGSVPTSQDSAALTGTRNTARLYGPVRTVLGKYRVYPDLLGKPFSERVGNDSVLRLLMCFGYGPLEIEDIRIGETPIADLIPSTSYNVLPGWDDDPALSIFRDEVDQDSSLQPELPREDPQPATLATSPGPEEISIDIAFPTGLIAFNDVGKPRDVTVRFTIQEREQGGTLTNIGTPSMGLGEDTGITEVSAGVFDIKLAERGLITRGLRWTVPSGSTPGAVHDVRVTRVSTTSSITATDRIYSDAKVTVIRSIKPHVASSIANLAKIELEINASETGLSNVIDNLSAVCTSIVPKYDVLTSSWGPTHANASAKNVSMFASRNAAWLYAHMLRGPMNSRQTPDNRIDGAGIAAWAGNLEGTGGYAISGDTSTPRNLDAVVDYTATTRKVLADIAGAGRASMNIIDGKYSVVQDIPQTQVIQHFSPRNSSGFNGAKAFRKKPHALRVGFVNPEKNYQRDERVVYDDGYNEDGSGGLTAATEFAELSLWGVADAEQVYRDARYHIASNRLRPEVFTITADVEHIVCNRGDLVRVSHDVIGVGYGGARIKTVSNSGGAFVSATIDEEFFHDPAKSYGARIRQSDGNELLVSIVNQGKTSSILEAETATSYGVTAAPAVGDLLLFGERETESLLCIVHRISPRNDLTALLELVEYNAAVYEPGTIPEHSSNISLQNQPTLLEPITPEIVGDLVSDETAISFSSAGAPEAQIILNVATPQHAEGSYAATTHYHPQFRLKQNGVAVTAWTNSPRVEATGTTKLIIRPVEEGEVYEVRVRAISDAAATASDWVYASPHTVVGLSTPPPAPTDLSVWGTAVRWEYGEKPADFAGFIVKHQSGSDATWATGISLSSNLITDNWVSIEGRIPPGQTTIMVRAVDIGGNESATLSAVRVVKDPELLSVVNQSIWTNVFAGTKTNCTHNTTTTHLEADVESSGAFWSGGDAATFWSATASDDFWGITTYKSMSYEQAYYIYDRYTAVWPVNDHLPGRQRFKTLELEGSEYTIEYRALLHIDIDPFTGSISYHYNDWKPWPGIRELQTTEYPFGTDGYEFAAVRVAIAGGTTQGKIKAGHLITEGLPKTHRETVSVTSGGTTIDLTGEGWRKITNVTVSPTNTADAPQGALMGEAYNLNAAQTTTTPYELTGPSVKLYTSGGAATSGTASVLIEGY